VRQQRKSKKIRLQHGSSSSSNALILQSSYVLLGSALLGCRFCSSITAAMQEEFGQTKQLSAHII